MTDVHEMLGVVTQGTGGVWHVRTDDGIIHEVSMRGRLKKTDTGRRAGGAIRRDTVAAARDRLKLAVGDRVRLEEDARGHTRAIAEILPAARGWRAAHPAADMASGWWPPTWTRW